MLSTIIRRRLGLLLLAWLLLAASYALLLPPPAVTAAGGPVHLPLVSGMPQPSPTPTASPTQTSPPGWSAYEVLVVELANQERAANGCGVALAMNDKLRKAAYDHSADMLARDFFSHTNPDGEGLRERVAEVGYDWWQLGENIAAGYSSPEDVMAGWMGSAGHRTNLLNCNFTEIGVGYVYSAGDGGTLHYYHYWTQDFGRPR